MKPIEEMTVWEIAQLAKTYIGTLTYEEAQARCKPLIVEANKKIKEFTDKCNKEYKVNRRAPLLRIMTDFNRFR